MLSSNVFNSTTSRSILHEALSNQYQHYKKILEDSNTTTSEKLMIKDLIKLCDKMMFELERDSSYKIQDLRV